MHREKDVETRTKRAQATLAMGLVKRLGDRFLVGAKSLKSKQGQHEVWRDETNKVRCTCDEFTEAIKATPHFRCEHILAVKLSLNPSHPEGRQVPSANTTGEGETEQPPPQKAQKGDQGMTNPDTSPAQEPSARADLFPTTPFRDILRRLSKPIQSDLIKQREGWRGHNGETHFVDYIEWHTVADLLDQVTPDWSHSVRSLAQIGDLVAVTASITIHGVTREGIGTGSAESEMGIKKAEHDALKRAAIKFGIARELYKHAGDEEDTSLAPDGATSLPRDPLAKTLADLVTPKQLVAIRAIAHAQGLQADEECLSLYGCKIEELSRRAASVLIDHLKLRQQAEPEQWRRAV